MAELVLRGGLVVDGTSAPGFRADVAVSAGRIQAIGDLGAEQADSVLEADGLVVAPGFIDCHSHSDLALLADPLAQPKVAQGVTTEIVGNCGFGPFPVRSAAAREMVLAPGPDKEPRHFVSAGEYRRAFERRGAAVNIAAHLPHGTLRASVMGVTDRPATGEELAAICALARQSFHEGALGISFGLLYAPGCFTPRDELVALGREAAALGRPLVFHVRNEADRFRESIAEAVGIGRECGAHVHISHLKVADPANWGRADVALAELDPDDGGVAATCDQYPYTAGSSSFQTLLPPWALVGGTAELLARLRSPSVRARAAQAMAGGEAIAGWDNLALRIGWERVAVGSAPGLEGWEGKTVAQIAAAARREPADVVFDLVLASSGSAIGIFHHMCEADVQTVMRHPAQMVGSDGIPTAGKPHPRLWGTFPRVLGRYVRELGLLSLEEAVHKMTGRPARAFGLAGRGILRCGQRADICAFDPAAVEDEATWEEPTRPPRGIVHVLCNGVPTMVNGRRTDRLPGTWVGGRSVGGI